MSSNLSLRRSQEWHSPSLNSPFGLPRDSNPGSRAQCPLLLNRQGGRDAYLDKNTIYSKHMTAHQVQGLGTISFVLFLLCALHCTHYGYFIPTHIVVCSELRIQASPNVSHKSCWESKKLVEEAVPRNLQQWRRYQVIDSLLYGSYKVRYFSYFISLYP